jgi:hypothetical protein
LFVGCDSKPEAPRTGLYGSLTNPVGSSATRAVKDTSASQPWTNGALAVVESELSPATLYHANADTLSFFGPDAATGLGAPSYICFSTEQGPKIFKPGDKIDPKRMRESWFVVWWSGARGWTNWDAPFFLTLQHRPAAIEFTTNGLQLKFNSAAGFAALLPLYGYDKSLPEAMRLHPFVQSREKKKRVFTWEWHLALPADPLARARFWASALREFPIACDETFSVDRAHDSVTFKQSFRWLSWNDDWNTKHVKLAPLSPVLALAYREKFPAEFSEKPFDMELPTRHGPFYGVQDVDSYEVTLPVLRYVHEMTGVGNVTLRTHAPCYDAWVTAHAGESWEMIRRHWPTLRSQFLSSSRSEWPAFSSVNVPPLEQAANALGAARLAYRLGDAETYAVACARFARAAVQLSAQQRGANYFREHQPWHSMTALDASATLARLTPDGWSFAKAAPATLDSFPDLARLWRDTQPAAREPIANPPALKVERLIPGYDATAFLPGEETAPNSAGLVTRLQTKPFPALISFWPEWKTSTGQTWNFGMTSVAQKSTGALQGPRLNANARVIFYPAP